MSPWGVNRSPFADLLRQWFASYSTVSKLGSSNFRHLIVGAAEDLPAGGVLLHTNPLLEEERHTGCATLSENHNNPITIERPRAAVGLATDNHPVYSVQAQRVDRPQHGLVRPHAPRSIFCAKASLTWRCQSQPLAQSGRLAPIFEWRAQRPPAGQSSITTLIFFLPSEGSLAYAGFNGNIPLR